MLIRDRVFGTVVAQRRFAAGTLVEIRYPPDCRLPLHAHEAPLFLLVLRGGFEETCAGRRRTCLPRQLLYRPPAEPHAQHFPGDATCLAIELPEWQDDAAIGGRKDLSGMAALLALRLYDEFARPTAELSLIVEETVAILTAPGQEPADARRPGWLDRAIELIESRLTGSIRLGDIAEEVGRHRVHVSRTLRRFFGCDVAEYVRRRRVHEACARIRSGGQSLSGIAASLGFSDESHMGRAFQQILGRSPGDYRRPETRASSRPPSHTSTASPARNEHCPSRTQCGSRW